MTLHPLSAVVPDGTGILCRQSRLHGAIGTAVMSILFIGGTVLWWVVGAPWFVWGGTGLLALLIVPLFLGDLWARFQPANWTLWITGEGLWINVRSYQNFGASDAETVAFVGWDEIGAVGRHMHSYSTPGSGETGSIRYRIRSLDIVLNHDNTALLREAIAAERRVELPMRRVFWGIRTRSRATVFAVSLPEGNCIRIAWRGGQGHCLAPKLDRVLEELGRRVNVAASKDESRDDWRDLSDSELNRQILELVQAGSRFDAMKLLRRRKGYTLAEAREFVEAVAKRM